MQSAPRRRPAVEHPQPGREPREQDVPRSKFWRYWEDRIRQRSTNASVGYGAFGEQVNTARKQRFCEDIDHALEGIVDPAWRVLDVGCGTGLVTAHLRDRFREVVAVDFATEGVRKTTERGGIDACVASAHALPFETASFDLITCFSVLYHIVDEDRWRSAIHELSRLVKPGGYILLRIEWLDNGRRTAEHVRHRAKDRYMHAFDLDGLSVEGLFGIHDEPHPRWLARLFPGLVSRARWFRSDPNNKLVLLRSGRPRLHVPSPSSATEASPTSTGRTAKIRAFEETDPRRKRAHRS